MENFSSQTTARAQALHQLAKQPAGCQHTGATVGLRISCGSVDSEF
jgi:hypothetical protein